MKTLTYSKEDVTNVYFASTVEVDHFSRFVGTLTLTKYRHYCLYAVTSLTRLVSFFLVSFYNCPKTHLFIVSNLSTQYFTSVSSHDLVFWGICQPIVVIRSLFENLSFMRSCSSIVLHKR